MHDLFLRGEDEGEEKGGRERRGVSRLVQVKMRHRHDLKMASTNRMRPE